MSSLTSKKAYLVPPDMVACIALGMETGDVIASRHGYTLQDWEALQAQDWFQRMVEVKRDDLRVNGHTFKAKAQMMAEDLLADVYLDAKKSDGAVFKLDTLKYFAKLADLEPKASTQVQSGGGFQINITFPGGSEAKLGGEAAPVVIAGEAHEVCALPERPKFITATVSNEELSGVPA